MINVQELLNTLTDELGLTCEIDNMKHYYIITVSTDKHKANNQTVYTLLTDRLTEVDNIRLFASLNNRITYKLRYTNTNELINKIKSSKTSVKGRQTRLTGV